MTKKSTLIYCKRRCNHCLLYFSCLPCFPTCSTLFAVLLLVCFTFLFVSLFFLLYFLVCFSIYTTFLFILLLLALLISNLLFFPVCPISPLHHSLSKKEKPATRYCVWLVYNLYYQDKFINFLKFSLTIARSII